MTNLIYILAASHSGSTLLTLLLNAHPQISTVGELKASHLGNIHQYRCSCGKLITECRFWNTVTQVMQEKGFHFNIAEAGTDFRAVDSRYAQTLLTPLCRGPFLETIRDVSLWMSSTWRKSYTTIQERNAALAETLCEISGAPFLVDSSKIGIRLKYLLRNPQIDVKVIRLIRDGRGVALAYMDPASFADAQNPSLRGGGMGGARDSEKLSIEKAAYEWRRSNEEAECLLASMDPSRWSEVRYESLCRDTEGIMRRLFEFIGVDSLVTVHAYRGVENHVLGNGMRLDSHSEIYLDDRWKTALSPEKQEIFRVIAGPLNHRYGYQ